MTVVLVMVLATALDFFLQRQFHLGERKQQELETTHQLSAIRAKLEEVLDANLLVIYGMASYIAVNPDLDQTRFAGFAQEIMRRPNLLKNMGAGPRPGHGHGAPPWRATKPSWAWTTGPSPAQRDQALLARDTGRMVVAGPLNLIQGGTGLIGRAPVYERHERGDRFWGLVSAVIDADRLFQVTVQQSLGHGLRLAIRGKDGKGEQGEVFRGSPELFEPRAGGRAHAREPAQWIVAHGRRARVRLDRVVRQRRGAARGHPGPGRGGAVDDPLQAQTVLQAA